MLWDMSHMELGSVFLLQTLKSSDHTPQTASDGLLTSPNIVYFENVGRIKKVFTTKFQPNILVHHWEVIEPTHLNENGFIFHKEEQTQYQTSFHTIS